MSQLTDQVTKQNWIADSRFSLPQRSWTPSRISLHVLFWAWDMYSSHNALDRVLRTDPTLPPDSDLFWLMFSTHIGTTMLLFYVYGYRVVPTLLSLLVQLRIEVQIFADTGQASFGNWCRKLGAMIRLSWRQILYVVTASLLVYTFFYIYDYYLYSYALTYIDTPPAYVTRNANLLISAGFSGIYNSYSAFTFIFAYNLSYILLPLLIRTIFLAIAWGVESTRQKEQNQGLIKNQLALLQNQINPHFLFNVFNNIYALIEQTNTEAANLLRSLSELLKYTIYETNESFVDLSGELRFLKNYVEIEKSRQFDSERITFQVFGDSENLLIPPLVLVTFVENAFKHGLHDCYLEGWVQISVTVDTIHDTLRLQIANYKKEKKSLANLPGGIGLTNVRTRLSLLFRPDQYTMIVSDKNSSYQVDLTLPLKRAISYVTESELSLTD